MTESLTEIIQSNQNQNSSLQQFGVSQTPFHTHNGIDSSKLNGYVTTVNTGVGLTGGPITSTGTISLDSKLAPADFLTGNAGLFLRVNSAETAVEYASASGGGTPGGNDTDVQVNNMGAFYGDSNFTYDYTNSILRILKIFNIAGQDLDIATDNSSGASNNITIKGGNGTSGGSINVISGNASTADITMTAGEDVNMTGGRDLNLTSLRNTGITSSQDITIKANAASANIVIQANGATNFLAITGNGATQFWVVGPSANDSILLLQKNVGINTSDMGGGVSVLAIKDAVTVPTVNPTGGGVLYSTGGALHWLGSAGTDTVIAPA